MKCIYTIVLFFCANYCTAQVKVSDIVEQVFKKPLYATSPAFNQQFIAIPCAFGKSALVFPAGMINLDTVQVTAIDLVFTDYPADNDLVSLNSNRLQHLFSNYPSLAKNNSITWQLVRQTDGALKEAAVNLFHGFVIYYRPLQNKATIKNDLIRLKESLTPAATERIKKDAFLTGDTTDTRKQYEIDDYTTVLKLPVVEALRFVGLNENEKKQYTNYDSLYVFVNPLGDSSGKTVLNPPVDSTVIKVFDRMHWDRMLVVADVTASMYPYTGQLLYWLKLHEAERRIKSFAFFNDGDEKEEEAKLTGATGGIYTSSSSVFEVIEQLVYKTMSNGNGGLVPENDVEALIKASAACKDCREIVLIADNASAVSDMPLLQQLHQPVHIILCGVRDGVTLDYLNIASSTGGSVHTAAEDVPLNNVQEGSSITIYGRPYKLSKGKFVAER